MINNALSFLHGDSTTTLEALETKMTAAAAKSAFESAAIFRDCLDNLTWLDRRLNGLRMANQNLNGILEIEARRNRKAWMVLRGGRIIATVPKPESVDNADEISERIIASLKTSTELPETLLDMSLQLIVIAWFRKHPEIKLQMLSPRQHRDYFCDTVFKSLYE